LNRKKRHGVCGVRKGRPLEGHQGFRGMERKEEQTFVECLPEIKGCARNFLDIL